MINNQQLIILSIIKSFSLLSTISLLRVVRNFNTLYQVSPTLYTFLQSFFYSSYYTFKLVLIFLWFCPISIFHSIQSFHIWSRSSHAPMTINAFFQGFSHSLLLLTIHCITFLCSHCIPYLMDGPIANQLLLLISWNSHSISPFSNFLICNSVPSRNP